MPWQPGPAPTDLDEQWPGPADPPGDRFFAAPPASIGEVTYAATELGPGGPDAGLARPIALGVGGAVVALVLYTLVLFPLLRDVLPGGAVSVLPLALVGFGGGFLAGKTLFARAAQCYFVGREGIAMFRLLRGRVEQRVLPFADAHHMEMKVHINKVRVGGNRFVDKKLHEARWLDAQGGLLVSAWDVQTREGWPAAHEAAKAFHSNAAGAWLAFKGIAG